MMTTTTYQDSYARPATRPGAWGLPRWFAPVLTGLVVEVFLLIALGGFVRITNAGLACPDWPLCFGDYIPDYHPQVYFEFIHRAMAGIVSLTTAALTLAMMFSRAPRVLKAVMIGALVLLLAQVVFGGLTVLWQLHAGVVATHLGMGTAFFAILLWLSLAVRQRPGVVPGARWIPGLVLGVTFLVYAQILLGGLVASNYAALVCLDFPKCQGEWFPTFQGMIGLHVMHRLGAYAIFLIIFGQWLLVRRASPSEHLQRLSAWMVVGVCGQVCLGIANVLFRTPPVIGVAHLALATFILSLGVRQVYLTRAL